MKPEVRWKLFRGALILIVSLFCCATAAAKDRSYSSYDDWWWWEGFCYAHDEWSDETPTLDARPDLDYPGYVARPVPDLDCWLTQAHPEIADSIKWRTGPGPDDFVAYPDWTWEQKTWLIVAVSHYWHWFENGYPTNMSDPFPVDATFGGAVPTNLAEPPEFDTVVSPEDAWHYYIDSIALSLAAQLGHWYRWDLRWGVNIFNQDLRYLFDSDQMFAANYWKTDPQIYYRVISVEANPSWPIHGAATLTSPLASLELFMRQKGLVRDTMDGTLYAALDWGRDNLIHFNGPVDRANEERVWQYTGLPPVLSMIQGTVAQNDGGQNWGDAGWGVRNYTMGCHGTSGFYKAVLRTVNIPVEVENQVFHSGMSFPMWPPWGVAGHITHSDALYSSAFRDGNHGLPFENPTTEPVSTSMVIVDDSEYQIWFDPSLPHEQRVANVDIGEQRYLGFWQPVPTTYLMDLYCSDLANGLSHADSSVYRQVFFNQLVGLSPSGFSVEALEAAFYWEWLEWRRVNHPGGCSAFEL
jgi:hypothetical protein